MPTLPEAESKRLLAAFGVPMVPDRVVADPEGAAAAALGDGASPAVAGVRESGMLCYPSAHRAVTALAHLCRDARWRRRRGL